ncbi:MAG: 6-bladed beta-propeller [Balneolaceae bacterium]|nr:6-bladed beta-propeller [Balneolaceae bacterium]
MNKLPQWTLIIIILFVFSCGKEKQKTDKDLIFHDHIGNGVNEGFIHRASSFTSDRTNYLYVDDSGQNYIIQYDLDGNFMRTIGRRGKGPGEFPSSNILTDVKDSLIFVSDLSGFRVSIFDTSGVFKSSFITEKRYKSRFFAHDSVLITSFGGFDFERDLKDKYQFDKFDMKGNLVSQFARHPITDNTNTYPTKFFFSRKKVSNGLLHVAYVYIPLYQIYDIQSERLLYEFHLRDLEGFETIEEQIQLGGDQPETILKSMKNLRTYVSYLDVVDNQVFIMHGSFPEFTIRHFRLRKGNLHHINSYSSSLESLNSKGILQFMYIPKKEQFYFLHYHQTEGFVVSVFNHK